MLTKWFYVLFSVLIVIGLFGCNEDSNPSSTPDNSPVGNWFFDTTATTEQGIASMNFNFNVNSNKTYNMDMISSVGSLSIKMADTGTWAQSGPYFIRTRVSTWGTNSTTFQYERITPTRSVDTVLIDIRNNQWYLTLSSGSASQTYVLTKK